MAPVGTTHGSGAQQSALIVHAPPFFMQVAEHLLFTHGLPQQSALVAQSCPAGTFVLGVHTKLTARQRGIPSASREQHASGLSLQKSGSGTPPSWSWDSQQLFEVPPQSLPSLALQTVPGRKHWSNGHRPKVSPDSTTHLIGGGLVPFDRTPLGRPGPPQQFSSFLQSSSCGLHPDGG